MNISSSRKALLAGVSGTALQWYDFTLFGYFASIIATNYFPNDNQFASILNVFGIFAVGYLLAPIGSLFFGYIGDQFGRKRALTLSILAMAFPTAVISIVPRYQTIGIAAPVIITLLRIIQGFVASSEFTGSAIFLVEHARPGRKAFYGSLTSSAYSTGVILAGLAASFFTASFMPTWGWRLGFASALIASILILYLRTQVMETPEYLQAMYERKKLIPFFTAVKESPYAIIGVIGIAWFVGIMTFGTYVFTATYLHSYFNISLSAATLIITLSLATDASLEPFIAILADRIGPLRVVRFGMLAMMSLSIPIFSWISTGNISWVSSGMVLMSILIAISYAPLNAYMVSLFPYQYRYSGFSVAFNIGISLFGGTTPMVLIWLVNETNNFISPAWYYMFGTIVGLVSLSVCEYGRRKMQRHPALTY